MRTVRHLLRQAAVSWLAGMAAFFAAWYAAPALIGAAAHQPTPAVSEIRRLAVDHGCTPDRLPGRTMLLISTPAGGPQLITAATTADEQRAQTDWLYDQRASWYGWCRP